MARLFTFIILTVLISSAFAVGVAAQEETGFSKLVYDLWNKIKSVITGQVTINEEMPEVSIQAAEDASVLWNKTIGGTSADYGQEVAIDSNDNVIVVGYTRSFGAGSSAFWTVKYNSTGDYLWNRTIGGTGGDEGYGVAVDSNDNIIVTGTTNSFGSGGYDFWTVKYNSTGDYLWNKTIGGSGHEYGYAIAIDSNDNIIVFGSTSSFGDGNSDFWTVKYNSTGDYLWNKTIGSSDYNYGKGVAIDSNDNIIVFGYTPSFGSGSRDFWTVKYNSTGDYLWNRTIGGISVDEGAAVAVDSNDNIIVTGRTNSFGVVGYGDFWTIKYNSNGDYLWNRTIGGLTSSDSGQGVAIDSNDNIIVTGYTNSFGAGSTDFWTVKYNSTGDYLWNKTIGGISADYGYKVAVDSNDSIIVIGFTSSFGAGGYDFWTVKYEIFEVAVPNITYTEFTGNTTDFSAISDFSSITNLTLHNPEYGKITWQESVDLSGGADLDAYINISFNKIEVNSSALSALNLSSIIQLFNLTFNNPQILINGGQCLSTQCIELSYTDGTLTFNVTHFTVYSARETPSAPAAEAAAEEVDEGIGCPPQFECGEWGECSVEGAQERVCEDTLCTFPDRIETQDCVYVAPAPEFVEELDIVIEETGFSKALKWSAQNANYLAAGLILISFAVYIIKSVLRKK